MKTKEDLDKEMDEYFLGNAEMASKKLDRDLDDYFSAKARKKDEGEDAVDGKMKVADSAEQKAEQPVTLAQGQK